MSEALYRKYRPQVFGDVVGQDHIERTLRNAIEQDKVSHAYLFCGPRGTGKTTSARLLAKALLCERGQGSPTPDPDGTCEDCRLIAEGQHPDVYELDAASRTGVDNVREEIIGRVQFAPTRGRYKVYIVDEVHMLSTAAFNALLKTLEEPPSHVVFILATTDPQKVPETILSRCQRFDFHRIGTEEMVARLGAVCAAEGVEFEGEALELVAHRAEGGMRDALTTLEQLMSFGEGAVSLAAAERMLGRIDSDDMAAIMQAVGSRDAAACFRWVAAYVETGADLAQFARDMASHVRNLYVMALTDAGVALEVGETERAQMTRELPLFGPDRLANMLQVLGETLAELKTSTNQRLTFEIALTRMVRPESDVTLSALAERVEALERGAAQAAFAPAAAPATPAASPTPAPAQPASASPASPETLRRGDIHVAPEAASPSAPASPASGERGRDESRPSDSAECAARPGDAAPAALDAAIPRRGDIHAAPVPAPTQPASDEFSNPAALQRMWKAALAALKRDKPAYGVLLMGTRVAYDAADGALSVEFPSENVFAFKASAKPEVQEAVSRAIEQAAGRRVPFLLRQRGAAQPAPAVSAEPAPAPMAPAAPAPTGPIEPAPAEPAAPAAPAEPAPATPAAPVPARPVLASPAPGGRGRPYDSAEVPPWAADDDEPPIDIPGVTERVPVVSPGIAPDPEPAPPVPESPASAEAPRRDDVRAVPADDVKDALLSAFGDGVVFTEG